MKKENQFVFAYFLHSDFLLLTSYDMAPVPTGSGFLESEQNE